MFFFFNLPGEFKGIQGDFASEVLSLDKKDTPISEDIIIGKLI